MPWLHFFADPADLVDLFTFIFADTDGVIFEAYSEYDRPIRHFHQTNNLLTTFSIGVDPYGHGTTPMLALWSASVIATPTIERIELNPHTTHGSTFRHTITGSGIIRLHCGGHYQHSLTASSLGYYTQAGARAKAAILSDIDQVDWDALKRLTNKLRYHIQRRRCVARTSSRPILRGAGSQQQAGVELKHDKLVR
jgi:hypothetical protein